MCRYSKLQKGEFNKSTDETCAHLLTYQVLKCSRNIIKLNLASGLAVLCKECFVSQDPLVTFSTPSH